MSNIYRENNFRFKFSVTNIVGNIIFNIYLLFIMFNNCKEVNYDISMS